MSKRASVAEKKHKRHCQRWSWSLAPTAIAQAATVSARYSAVVFKYRLRSVQKCADELRW